jgi:hypothetical protein
MGKYLEKKIGCFFKQKDYISVFLHLTKSMKNKFNRYFCRFGEMGAVLFSKFTFYA